VPHYLASFTSTNTALSGGYYSSHTLPSTGDQAITGLVTKIEYSEVPWPTLRNGKLHLTPKISDLVADTMEPSHQEHGMEDDLLQPDPTPSTEQPSEAFRKMANYYYLAVFCDSPTPSL
jgi:hypothetical protein